MATMIWHIVFFFVNASDSKESMKVLRLVDHLANEFNDNTVHSVDSLSPRTLWKRDQHAMFSNHILFQTQILKVMKISYHMLRLGLFVGYCTCAILVVSPILTLSRRRCQTMHNSYFATNPKVYYLKIETRT